MVFKFIKASDPTQLPKEPGIYLTAVHVRFSTDDWFSYEVMEFDPVKDDFTNYETNRNLNDFDSIYWMPLPEDPEECL